LKARWKLEPKLSRRRVRPHRARVPGLRPSSQRPTDLRKDARNRCRQVKREPRAGRRPGCLRHSFESPRPSVPPPHAGPLSRAVPRWLGGSDRDLTPVRESTSQIEHAAAVADSLRRCPERARRRQTRCALPGNATGHWTRAVDHGANDGVSGHGSGAATELVLGSAPRGGAP
jgi:hypothetical protein